MITENLTPETKEILDSIQVTLVKLQTAIKALPSGSNKFFYEAFDIIESSMVKIGATPKQEVLKRFDA
jgi:hypothetical protein